MTKEEELKATIRSLIDAMLASGEFTGKEWVIVKARKLLS